MEKVWGVVALRWFLAFVLPGSLIIGAPPDLFLEVSIRVGGIALFLLAANVLWWWAARRDLADERALGYLMCLFDLTALAFGLHLYGGASGVSGFLFLLVVLEGGFLLDRRGAGLVVGAVAGVYALLLLVEAQGLGNPLFPSPLGDGLLEARINLLVQAAIKIFLFLLVSEVASRFRETLAAAHEEVLRNEKEAKFMAEFNRAIIENVPVGVIVLAADGRVVVYNAAMERITEVPPADAIERHYDKIFPGLAAQWEASFQKVQETGEEMHLLGVRIPTLRGREFTANVRILPLKSGEAVLGVVLAFQTAKR
jgi:PAS domain S-box-containing protein